MNSFWDFFWFILSFFVLMAYLMVLFYILTDLFRDKDTSGWIKAVWIVTLIFFPIIVSLIYLIVRGRDMTERQASAMQAAQRDQEAYIRSVATSGTSATDQIAQAKSLLDSGAISPTEFESLKSKALA